MTDTSEPSQREFPEDEAADGYPGGTPEGAPDGARDEEYRQQPSDEGPESTFPSPEELEQLQEKARERDVFLAELHRAKADLENYQKRVRRDRAAWETQAVGRVLVRLLPVIDDFERAFDAAGREGVTVESLAHGVRITRSSFLDVLQDIGVEEIMALGQPFNPEFHEAVVEEVSDRPTGEVTAVMQKGYLRDGTVLRPARVRVARNPGTP